jgi:hypothetical protein
MKNLIAISAASLSAASALGGTVSLSTDSTTWTNGASYYSSVGTTLITDTLQYAVQTNSNLVTYAAPGNGYHSWANWTASTTNGSALTLSGGYLNPNQLMTATPGGSNIVIAFDPATQPANPQQGIMGAGILYAFTGAVSIDNITVTFDNGQSSSLGGATGATSGSGFVGVWNQNPFGSNWYKVASITLSTSGAGTLTIDTIYVGLVPAPGAVALVGVAGLVGSRRRRA